MNDRITIRLDNKDIELIDVFVKGNPEFSTRSEFLRIAALEYIKMSGQARLGQMDEMKIRLGPRNMDKLFLLLSTERYDTPQQAATDLFKIGLGTVDFDGILKEEGMTPQISEASQKYRDVEEASKKYNTR